MEKPVNWRQLREFADVDLESSFVLSWHYEAGSLLVDVDLLLTPAHPFYEKPRPKEKVCIRPAIIEFPHCDALSAEAVHNGQPPGDVTRGLPQGAISGFRVLSDGRYELSGDFGAVQIDAERPILRLKAP